MGASLTPTQDDVQSALRAFLLSILPSGVDVIAAIQNRVPELAAGSFVIMQPIRFERLATNLDSSADVKVTGSIAPQSATITGTISGSVLNVTAVAAGTLVPGAGLAGTNVVASQQIISQINGTPGSVGSYKLAINQQNLLTTPMTASYGLLTVAEVFAGQVTVGAMLFGSGVAAGTVVQELGTGAGGTGTYYVSPGQATASGTISAGADTLMQSARIVVQCDFHSADNTAADMAMAVSTAFRDEYATTFFANEQPNYGDIVPLHADDPRMVPFVNDSNQYEWRWSTDVHLQVNQVLSVPLQYMDEVDVSLVSVEAEYPPA